MLEGLLGRASTAVAGGRAAAGAYAREVGARALAKGGNVLRAGMRELISPTGTYARSGMRMVTRGSVNPGAFGYGAHVVAPTFAHQTVTSKIPGLAGSFMFQAMPRFAAANALDWYASTPAGEESSGFSRALMGAASFGLRVGAYRHMARGIGGSALSMGGRMAGDSSKFGNAYSWLHTKTGGLAVKGSLTNMAFKGIGGLGKEAVKLPFRMAIGAPYAAVAGIRTAGKLSGIAGRDSLSSILTPQFGKSGGRLQRFGKWTGLINKHGDAPMMSGFITMGMAAGAAHQAWRRDTTPYSMRGLNPMSSQGIRPSYYGGGIQQMRHGNTRNYGPSLTLQMHRNHSRVMPY